MQRPQFRLEILKLIHRHDQAPEMILARAKDFEAWVLEAEAEAVSANSEKEATKRKPGRPPKSGNTDILD
jgi:hypothetical protein